MLVYEKRVVRARRDCEVRFVLVVEVFGQVFEEFIWDILEVPVSASGKFVSDVGSFSHVRPPKMKKYLKAIKKYMAWHGRFNGLDVYIPTRLDDFETHANALNQCLVYGDYIGKVARGKCVIVFLKDKDKPLATAELDLIDGKPVLGQFHGNQDLDDISPTPKAQKAMDLFMKKYVSAA